MSSDDIDTALFDECQWRCIARITVPIIILLKLAISLLGFLLARKMIENEWAGTLIGLLPWATSGLTAIYAKSRIGARLAPTAPTTT